MRAGPSRGIELVGGNEAATHMGDTFGEVMKSEKADGTLYTEPLLFVWQSGLVFGGGGASDGGDRVATAEGVCIDRRTSRLEWVS